ncbi:hypothetical protein B0H11DRAFT_1862672 [Mycena galericulata]|nr:hypothetical protein B0H11DRAFT_1862672 [Mycena galericulata]
MESEEPLFRLYLAPEHVNLYLDVPISVVSSLCIYPAKYLQYLGYCILGVPGIITRDLDGEPGEEISDEDPLDAGVYRFIHERDVLAHAVDPAALTYSHSPETTNTRDNFRTIVAERDVSCVFTNTAIKMCKGIHIVPYKQGDSWLKQIIESRFPEEDEDVTNLTSINDIRNGILVANTIHPMIDQKNLVVLKTPNRVLNMTDIPPRSNNDPDLLGDVKYSTNPRYTLQWLQGNKQERRSFPNNMDAAFKKICKNPKPSPLLLNYNYGVAALKWWGRGKECLLTARMRPIAAPLGPPKSKHDSALKFDDARTKLGALEGGSGGNTESVDIDELRQSQAEELVLAFWSNTPAARTRLAKKRAERQERMIGWQNGVRMALKSET